MMIHALPNGDQIHRYKKSIVITFAGKRHVISTGPNNGGYREDLQAVFNNDGNLGAGMAYVMRAPSYEEHMNLIAMDDLGLDPAFCTGLTTAASMENVSIQSMSYEDLTVTAIVTGGIEHNGGRVGDPAVFHEGNGRFIGLSKEFQSTPGTINILLHITANLDAGTLARTIVTATEAKTTALAELLAPSCNSHGIATGSGTDGTIVICDPKACLSLTNAGKNSKLGELIGVTVMNAVKETLRRQSGLCPEYQHDVLQRMGRFGVTEDSLWNMYSSMAADASKQSKADFINLLDHNKRNPELVTCTSLYAHLLDQLDWGMLSPEEVIKGCEQLLTLLSPDDTHSISELSSDDTHSFSDNRNIVKQNHELLQLDLCKRYSETLLNILLK